ncbi:MAG: PAS domain S-box protein [Candidatus Hydrogenedentes bacterium]|nr:PAS domain S-box protein [Candidatus Hydrogenedentota bacterium]
MSLEAATYLVAAFAIAGLGSYKAATAATYMEAVKWSQAASIVSQASLVWLVARLTGQRPLALLIPLTGAFAIALLIHITSVSGLFMSYLRELYLVSNSWGEGIVHPRNAFDFWRAPIDVPNVIALMWIPYAFWRQYRRGEWLRALLGSLLVLVIVAANLHDMFFVGPVYLAPYGLLLMLVVFWKYRQPALIPTTSGVESPSVTEGTVRRRDDSRPRRTWLLLGAQNPLVGAALAMLLVSVAQGIGSDTLESVVVLLVLVGMMQATIGVLYRVGSGKWLRRLAVLALCILGLSQMVAILHGVGTFPELYLLGPEGLLHPRVHDWLWIFGLLLVLSAFYLAGMEAGDTRKKLVLEHDQLVAEVAERRRAEENLRKSEKRFRALIENCSDIVAVLNEEGRFLYVGTSVGQILGYSPDTMVGKKVFEFCHPDDLTLLTRALERISFERPHSIRATEVRIRHSDGSWRVMEGIGRNRLSDPVLNGIVVNARDITERKLMANRLETVKAEEQQRIRHDLHDTVGQDLTGLLCMAGSLTRKLQKHSGPDAAQADAIVKGVRHTIEDVRRAIHGIAPVEADPRGLEVALAELADKARAQHEIEVRFECHAPVPVADYGAATQLFRIAQEALTNAVKHARARRIVLTLVSETTRVAVVVADDGIGIDGRRRLTSGMGLHTMRSRASAIGATLTISGAAAGNGTRVECILGRDQYEDDTETEDMKGPHHFEI